MIVSNRNSIFNCVASIFKFRGRVKVTQACRSPPGVPGRSVNSISTGGSDYAHHIIKVHIFWEGHKILWNLQHRFVVCSTYQSNLWWRFRKNLWPSQNIWTLKMARNSLIVHAQLLVNYWFTCIPGYNIPFF